MEVWKDIKGYEGLYRISNMGRVKSLERTARNNIHGGERTIKESILSPTDNGHGYMLVGLKKDCKRKNHYVHRLVAEHFVENPLQNLYVNHLDYDKSNNKATNLEWCTQGENIAHSNEHMRKPKAKCRVSNTGEKYITKSSRHGNLRYRVIIKSIGVERCFVSLSDAIQFRNEVMQAWQNL